MTEIEGGLRIVINNDEKALLLKIKKEDGIPISKLSDSELITIDSLLRKNLVAINNYKIECANDLRFQRW